MTREEAFAEKFTDVLERISIAYEHSLRAGVAERVAFESCRDAFVNILGVDLVRAANLTRVVIALTGARHGQQVYSREDFKQILELAI